MIANVIATHKCNLRCKHCFYIEKLLDEEDDVSLENWKILKSKREKLGIDKFNFTGGEATICHNILPFISDCKQNSIDFSLFTNGINVSPQIIDGCDEYYLSVDGVGHVHDTVRNMNGAYDKIVFFLRSIKNKDKRIHIQTTISKINIDYLEPLIDLYAEMYPQLASISLVAAVNQGNTLNNRISLTKSELNRVKKLKEEILERFHYHIFVKDNLYTLTQLKEFTLSSRSAFPMWIDLILGEAYVLSDKYKIDIGNLSEEWISEQYRKIRRKIGEQVIWLNEGLYVLEDLV